MTRLILIRHGETDWNRERRFQGHADIGLNPNGQQQAHRLAARLATESFDAIHSSDLRRARDSVQALADGLGLPLQLDAGLREQSFGVMEGLLPQQVAERWPEVWQQWALHDADWAPPGGESTRQFHARVLAAVRRIAAAHHGQQVLVATHGGVLDMLWRDVHGLPLQGARDCHIPNCGINRLQLDDERLTILQWADDAHMADLPPQPSTEPVVLGGR
jgi:probable phosphoglycerate mutase